MNYFWSLLIIYTFALNFCLQGQTNINRNQDTININCQFSDTPYYLDSIPIVKLPRELNVDSLHGKVVVSVWIDINGRIKWHCLRVLLLKNKYDEYIINYRSSNIKLLKKINIKYYPLEIQPYVIYFKTKMIALKLNRNKKIKRQEFYFNIPFYVI